ncbi:unnamed protein product [Protopolystoma xenopodis]|uniref:Uncharacterized protein n=1 Tax=Protopolystoma xenopodis TaxID=117903 RepID=A0A448WVW2_9PLAT|nr:unnamed protein product [Protopolystoma xenopodis]
MINAKDREAYLYRHGEFDYKFTAFFVALFVPNRISHHSYPPKYAPFWLVRMFKIIRVTASPHMCRILLLILDESYRVNPTARWRAIPYIWCYGCRHDYPLCPKRAPLGCVNQIVLSGTWKRDVLLHLSGRCA